MLFEIRSDQFRTKHIGFHKGLNVILGDENATNSIGKSTLLMIIDFAFGGNSLLNHNQDLIKELGHHDYFFAFEFGEDICQFRRGTYEPEVIYCCNEDYETTSHITLEKYTAFLKVAYDIAIEDISFRNLVSLYFRVWGKDNLNVHKPLHTVQTTPNRDCISNLIKTFGYYDTIKTLTEDLKTKEEERKALSFAFKKRIIPKIGKLEHKANEERIKQIEREINDINPSLTLLKNVSINTR